MRNILIQIKSGCIIVILFFGIEKSYGQMSYLGLKSESNVRAAQLQLNDAGLYWPKSQIIDGVMYIPTINGIYRKNLNSISDTLWSLYAFPGVPVRDFIKNNDSVLAITAMFQDSLLLLSVDNGLTYINFTSPYFFNYEPTNTIRRISKNPLNPNSIIALHDAYGVSKSNDFGNTWFDLNAWGGGYQERFVGFNPNDTTNIFYTGETGFFASYIQASYNSGITWSLVHTMHNHCIHHLAFHPTNPDVIISVGEGLIKKSQDRGLTWNIVGSTALYLYKIIYDEADSNILYTTGDFNGYDDTLRIYRSTDGGNNWSLAYTEIILNSDGILDIHMYQGKLFIYTLINGVFMLDPVLLSTQEFDNTKNEVQVFPNPAGAFLNVKVNGSEHEFAEIILYDITSHKVLEQKFIESVYLNIESLAKGIYLYEVRCGNSLCKKGKVVKH